MELSVFFTVFTVIWEATAAISCYKCEGEPVSATSCEGFAPSEPYLVACAAATMCFKREVALDVSGRGDTVRSVSRGCAAQKSMEQHKVEHKWRVYEEIHEVYDEACQEVYMDEERLTKTTICYCRGDGCNASTGHYPLLGLLALALSIVLKSQSRQLTSWY